MPARFAAIILTANPPGMSGDASGAMVKIDGREALVRSVELFLNRDNLSQVVVVFQPAALDDAKKKFGGHFGFTGVRVAAGGPTWIDQITAGVAKLPDDATHVILHDAARPIVAYTDIDAVLEVAESHDAVALTTPLRSPLIELDEARQPVGDRAASEFAELLTPQVFSKPRLARAVAEKALPHASELHLLPGSPLNLRLTSSGDAALAKSMINLLPKPKLKASSPFEEAQW